MRYYVGFSQIGSHIAWNIHIVPLFLKYYPSMLSKQPKDLVCCVNDSVILILKSTAGWYLGILVILRYGNVTKPVLSTIISMSRFLLCLGTLLRLESFINHVIAILLEIRS